MNSCRSHLGGLRSLISLVKNHYFATSSHLRRVAEIEQRLAELEESKVYEPQALQPIHSELRFITDCLIEMELGKRILFDGVPIKFLERAIELAEMSTPEDERLHPRVGAVIIKDDRVISEGFRNQDRQGGHAEQIAVETCTDTKALIGSTLITTLEPCTDRGSRGRRPCSEIIIRFGISTVHIGLHDANPTIRGRGDMLLRKNNISVSHFPSGLSTYIWQMNRDFFESKTSDDFQSVFLYKS